jgi:hypothetical protein
MRNLKTHPLNVSYLVVGLIFLGIAGFWALRAAGVVDGSDGRWLGPLLLVGAGGAGLVGLASKNLRRDRHDDTDLVVDEVPAFDPYPAQDSGSTLFEPTPEIQSHDTEGEHR